MTDDIELPPLPEPDAEGVEPVATARVTGYGMDGSRFVAEILTGELKVGQILYAHPPVQPTEPPFAAMKTPTEVIQDAIDKATAEHPGKWLQVVAIYRQTEDGSGALDEVKITIDPPVQPTEPVAWRELDSNGGVVGVSEWRDETSPFEQQPLYAHPPTSEKNSEWNDAIEAAANTITPSFAKVREKILELKR